MRILLTNDDGISSAGMNLLAAALRENGHRVFVVAPDSNRSGTSHSISFLDKPCKITEIEKDTWTCSGTPVDCIIVGLLGGIGELCIASPEGKISKENAPDLILSGINIGANLGTDIVYSGTAAAARQGSFFDIPSVALSLVENKRRWHWEPVISYIVENLSEITAFWKAGTFVNVNFPNNGKKPSALVPTFPSVRYYNDTITNYKAPYGGLFCFPGGGKTTGIGENGQPEEGSDWAEVLNNNAALSVVLAQPVAVSGPADRGGISKG